MKKIKTSNIIAGSAMPLKSGSLDHLQSANQEGIFSLAQSELFQRNGVSAGYGSPQALYGLGYTVSGSTWSIESGCLVFGTEMYLCDSTVGITLGVGQVVIGTITTTFLTATNADPVVFSDSTSNNVHEIRKIVWSAGTSGSGSFNFTDIQYLGRWIDYAYSASYLSAATGAWTVATSSNFQVRVQRRGSTATISIYIVASTISLTTTTLTLTLPFTDRFKGNFGGVCHAEYTISSTRHVAKMVAINGTRDIEFSIVSPFWTGTTNGFNLFGEIVVQLDNNES